MTKTDDTIFEIECPARTWRLRATSEFSRDSWFESIFNVWKGIDHKKDIYEKRDIAQKVCNQQQSGYNGYHYDHHQNIEHNEVYLQSEGVSDVYPNLKKKDSIDILWNDGSDKEEGICNVTKEGHNNESDTNIKQETPGLLASVPDAPNGFIFHRVNYSLSIIYNCYQVQIRLPMNL